MTIVLDLGCAPHDGEASIEPLVEKFDPLALFGFDPALQNDRIYEERDTLVVLRSEAAWLFDGEIPYIYDGLRSRTGAFGSVASCFDFPEWLRTLDYAPIVCKMDIEGAEIPLLEALHEAGDDARLEMLIVEWHEHMPEWNAELARRRDRLVDELRCPIVGWDNA